jgi:Xaa-Pro dipeptidase
MPFVPRAELDHRLARLREVLTREDLDGALLHGTTSLIYFAGTAQQAHLWVPAEGDPVLLVRRVLERARAESALDAVEPLASLKALPGRLGTARRIGMELDILPATLLERYRTAVPSLDPVDIGLATRVVRAVKSTWEVGKIRAAARAADAAFREAADALSEGMSELELAIVLESAERRHGFQGMIRWRAATGFECPWVHVLAGPSALAASFADTPYGGEGVTPAAPYGAGHRRIGRGVPVNIDFALARDGYIHDMTRTLSIGELPDELVKGYELLRTMHLEVRAAARPGVTGEALWERCLAIADSAGLGERFMGLGAERVRFVGHGVGLELDELPVLAPRQHAPLEAGHVIAVEPKLFYPGVGAIGLEDTYLVTGRDLELLTVTPDELVVV